VDTWLISLVILYYILAGLRDRHHPRFRFQRGGGSGGLKASWLIDLQCFAVIVLEARPGSRPVNSSPVMNDIAGLVIARNEACPPR
jgi:hypothetical protein